MLLLAAVLLFSASYPGRVFWNQLFLASGFGGAEEVTGLRIHVMDVGKADAILVQCGEHAGLIDAGPPTAGTWWWTTWPARASPPWDFVAMTHPDSDHIGGMAQVLREVPVKTFLQSEFALEADSLEYDALQRELDRGGFSRRALAQGDTFSLGEAVFTVLGPFRAYEDTNNSSLVCRLEYQGFTALFCGDIEEEAELDYVKSAWTWALTCSRSPTTAAPAPAASAS